ncbi:hypothetical protein ABK040_002192 [Willaertia magna]
MHCKIHLEEEINLCCTNCGILTCKECFLKDHKLHYYMNVKDAYEEFIPVVSNSLNIIEEYKTKLKTRINDLTLLRSNLETNKINAQDQVKDLFKQLRQFVDEREERVIEEISTKHKEKDTNFGDKLEQLDTQLGMVKYSCNYVKKALEIMNEAEVLSMKPFFLKRLEELNDLKILQCKTNDYLQFTVKNNILKKITKLLCEIGSVTAKVNTQLISFDESNNTEGYSAENSATTAYSNVLDCELTPVVVFKNEKDSYCKDYNWLQPFFTVVGRFKIELENDKNQVVYSANGCMDVNDNKETRKFCLSNGDTLFTTGKDYVGNHYYQNGYGIIIYSTGTGERKGTRLTVLTYLLPNGKKMNKPRRHMWTRSHEICFKGKDETFYMNCEMSPFLGL